MYSHVSYHMHTNGTRELKADFQVRGVSSRRIARTGRVGVKLRRGSGRAGVGENGDPTFGFTRPDSVRESSEDLHS